MKFTLSVFALLAFVAFVHSTPVAQEEVTPNRPILNAISSAASTANQVFEGITNTAYSATKRVAETAGQVIDNTASTMSSGINTVANAISGTIISPFQSSVSDQ